MQYKLKNWLWCVLLIAGCGTQGWAQSTATNRNDINYAGDDKVYHNLDIQLPKAKKAAYPVVVVIYGSAWFGNNLKGMAMQTLGDPLLDAGFAVVAPNHRSSNDAKFPAQINDIKAAIRFIKANAAQYGLDTSFIGITGFSSGGHLAALTGTSGGVENYTVRAVTQNIEGSVGGNMQYNSKVNAVVDWFGPIDVLVMDSWRSGMIHNAANSPESRLIGGSVQENKDKATLVNPIIYIDKGDPPFLILHGDKDPLVPYCQSELLYKALQKAGIPSQYVLVPDAQHGPGLFKDTYYKMMTDFFLKQLNKK